jgi:hypothetical protein
MVDGQLFVESLLSFYKGNRSLIFCLSFALFTTSNINKLESVQKNAARFVLNQPHDYKKPDSTTKMVKFNKVSRHEDEVMVRWHMLDWHVPSIFNAWTKDGEHRLYGNGETVLNMKTWHKFNGLW